MVNQKDKEEGVKLTVLTAGDDPYTSTGYGNVWENLLKRWPKLKPDWKFYHVGWQNRDRLHEEKEGYWMLPIIKNDFAFDCIHAYLVYYNPDFFISMADIGIQSGFIDGVFAARKDGWRGKWIAWNPFDTNCWEELFWTKCLEVPDINMAMADWGEYLMNKHNVKNVKKIPLGTDTKLFKPLERKDELKKRFNLQNKFVIGFVGKNQRRKMIPYLIKSFAQFSRDKEDVKLILHTDSQSPTGWGIDTIIKKFECFDQKLREKVALTKANMDTIARQKIGPEYMVEIYNTMDVFGYFTGGEGFGIPGLECQSCGVPLIMTKYSTAFELTDNGNQGWLVPVLNDEYENPLGEIGNNGVENAIPNYEQGRFILEEVYNDWKSGGKKLKEYSIKAREFALKYDYDIIADKWIKFFENEL